MDQDLCGEEDKQVIGQCLRAIAFGPFMEGEEDNFELLIGADQQTVAALSRAWPACDIHRRTIRIVNNSLLHLVGYPHYHHDVWSDYISVSEAAVGEVLKRWRRQHVVD